MKAPLYTQAGEKKGDITLLKELFEAPINEGLMHQAMVRQLSNGRVHTAYTLTRGDVKGGGRKPFRQKGRGRARHGSIRSPIFRGGGVVFGPRAERSFSKDMPKKMRRAALFSALSAKAKEVIVLQKYEAEMPKTKDFVALLSKLPAQRRVLVILPESNVVVEKSVHNIPDVKALPVQYLNIIDLLWADTVIFLEESLKRAEEIYLK